MAMNIDSGTTLRGLLCPTWNAGETSTTVKINTTILHSRNDDVVPFADSQELLRNSNLPESALIEVGTEHRLADEESLEVMLEACEWARLEVSDPPTVSCLRSVATSCSRPRPFR